MDFFGPSKNATNSRKYYAFVIVDDFSWYTWVLFLANKDDEILSKQPKWGGGWIGFLKFLQNLIEILNEFKVTKSKSTKIYKDKGKEIQTQRFLRGSANLTYVYTSKHIGLEDSTNQALKASRTFTIDFKGVNQPLHQEIIPNLLTQVYPNTYNHAKQRLQICFSLT